MWMLSSMLTGENGVPNNKPLNIWVLLPRQRHPGNGSPLLHEFMSDVATRGAGLRW